jgi:hypothetical protein
MSSSTARPVLIRKKEPTMENNETAPQGAVASHSPQEWVPAAVYAMSRLRRELLKQLDMITDTTFSVIVGQILANMRESEANVLMSYDLLTIKDKYIENDLIDEFEKIIDLMLERGMNVVTVSEIVTFMDVCRRVEYMGPYVDFAILAIRYFGRSISAANIGTWMNACVKRKRYRAAKVILSEVLRRTDTDVTVMDMRSWMDLLKPGASDDKPKWEHYADIARTIVENGARSADSTAQEIKLEYPGISGTFAGEDIQTWIRTLKDAQRNDLAAFVEIGAYEKGFRGITMEEIHATVRRGYTTLGFGSVDTGVVLHANMIEHLHGQGVDRRTLLGWINEATGYSKTENAHMVTVAAINNDMATRADADQWVTGLIGVGMLNQSFETAIAAVKHGIPELTAGDVERWMKLFAPYHAHQIMCAALKTELGAGITSQYIQDLSRRCAGDGEIDFLTKMVLTALETGSDHAIRGIAAAMGTHYFEYSKLESHDIRRILDILFNIYHIDQAEGIFLKALTTGHGSGIDRELVETWAGKCSERGSPVKAVEMGLAARGAGIDVSDAHMQQWQAACFEGATPETMLANEVALINAYRSRMRGAEPEVDSAYARLMQDRETADTIDSMPVADALEKIRSILA